MADRQLISFDWALKRLLRSKANFEILEGFLTELLKVGGTSLQTSIPDENWPSISNLNNNPPPSFYQGLKIVEVLESESNQNREKEKFNRVDLKAVNQHGDLILIEVQYERELDFLLRILFGAAKTITEHMNSGDSYDKVVKVISISILYFDLGKGEDYVYRGKTSFHGIHKHDELELSEEQQGALGRESVEDLYPEFYLIKVKQFDDVAKDRLDEWIYFLKNEEIKDDFSAMGLQKAKQVLSVLKLSKQERAEYERYEENLHYEASMYQSSYVSGERKGLKKGREEGELLGKIKNLEELKQDGVLSEEDYQKRIIPLQNLLKELES